MTSLDGNNRRERGSSRNKGSDDLVVDKADYDWTEHRKKFSTVASKYSDLHASFPSLPIFPKPKFLKSATVDDVPRRRKNEKESRSISPKRSDGGGKSRSRSHSREGRWGRETRRKRSPRKDRTLSPSSRTYFNIKTSRQPRAARRRPSTSLPPPKKTNHDSRRQRQRSPATRSVVSRPRTRGRSTDNVTRIALSQSLPTAPPVVHQLRQDFFDEDAAAMWMNHSSSIRNDHYRDDSQEPVVRRTKSKGVARKFKGMISRGRKKREKKPRRRSNSYPPSASSDAESSLELDFSEASFRGAPKQEKPRKGGAAGAFRGLVGNQKKQRRRSSFPPVSYTDAVQAPSSRFNESCSSFLTAKDIRASMNHNAPDDDDDKSKPSQRTVNPNNLNNSISVLLPFAESIPKEYLQKRDAQQRKKVRNSLMELPKLQNCGDLYED